MLTHWQRLRTSKYDELFKSSTSNETGLLLISWQHQQQVSLGLATSSTSSGTISMGVTDQAMWCQTGRKSSVSPAQASEMPMTTAESVLLEQCLPTETLGLANESSDLAAEGSGLATDASSSSSCFGSSTPEQSVLHLMMCPLMQVQSLCPCLIGRLLPMVLSDWHDVTWQKWLTAVPQD